MFFQIDGKCAFDPSAFFLRCAMVIFAVESYLGFNAGSSPVGDAPFTYGWIPLQLLTYDNCLRECSTSLLLCIIRNNSTKRSYENYTLEQFDETICLFKLMENVMVLSCWFLVMS